MSGATVTPELPALDARGVRVELGGATILDDVGLRLDAGSLVAMVGPNGAGKSTLARVLAGMQKFKQGSVECLGHDIRGLRGRRLARLRAFVPQRARVPDGITVAEAIRIGRSAQLPPLGRATHADRDAISRAIETAGIERFRDRMLSTLSGGELQRVQIAIGLAQSAPVLIADEPTSQLDLGATVVIAKLLRRLADEGIAVLVVVHDLSLAAALADRVVVISRGRSVAEGAPGDVLDRGRLADVWGVDAELHAAAGQTGLRVDWLGETNDKEAG